jgi:hypothetical protein
MGASTAFLAVLVSIAAFHPALAAVTLTAQHAASNHKPHDIRAEPISKATFAYLDNEPYLLWGEATDDTQKYVNRDAPVAAYATYNREAHNRTGWGELWITTTTEVPMLEAMFAAGMLSEPCDVLFICCSATHLSSIAWAALYHQGILKEP